MVECFSTEAFAKSKSKTIKGSGSVVEKEKKIKVYELKISFKDDITIGKNNEYKGKGTQTVSLDAPGKAYNTQIYSRTQNIISSGKKIQMSIGFPSGVTLTRDTQKLDEVNINTYDMNKLSYQYSVLGDVVSELKEKSMGTARVYIPWAQKDPKYDKTHYVDTGYVSYADAYFNT